MRYVQWKCVLLIVINIQTSLPFSVVPNPPSPTRVKDTKVIVDGRATVVIDTLPRQHNMDNNVTLTDYMRLPVEQYVLIPMPLGSNLRKLESNIEESSLLSGSLINASICTTEFELTVPTIKFFKLSLQPVVYAKVLPYHDRVIISSTKCVLGGSPFIEKVKLNDRFDFSVNTTLTWEDDDEFTTTNDIIINNHDNLGVIDKQERVITAETCISVNIDVPKPFNTIPKRLIERAGNAAMKVSLNHIQANFINNLAIDYIKWSSDSHYRQYRESLSMKE